MRVLFAIIWAFFLIIPQVTIRISPFDIPLGVGFITILVIFIGFEFPLVSGFMAVAAISLIAESFSRLVHGHLVLSHLILFLLIQVVMDKIYTEAYVTKAFWVLAFSILHLFFVGVVLNPHFMELDLGLSVLQIVLQSLVNAIVSFPLIILFDFTFSFWGQATARRKASVTGADLFAAHSSQRKFIK